MKHKFKISICILLICFMSGACKKYVSSPKKEFSVSVREIRENGELVSIDSTFFRKYFDSTQTIKNVHLPSGELISSDTVRGIITHQTRKEGRNQAFSLTRHETIDKHGNLISFDSTWIRRNFDTIQTIKKVHLPSGELISSDTTMSIRSNHTTSKRVLRSKLKGNDTLFQFR